MTRPDPKPDQVAAEDAERIAAELAALGEDPLGEEDDALAFALTNTPDVDVAAVQTMAQTMALWADSDASDEALSELAQARVWRTIELRTKPKDAPEPVVRRPSTRPLVLGVVVAMLAVAAGVVLVPVLMPSPLEPATPVAKAPQAPRTSPISAEELEVLSTQARASLAALDRLTGEPRGSARAQAMADDYARRLEAEG